VKSKIMEQLNSFRLNHSKPYSANDLEILMEDWFDALSEEKIDMILFQRACLELRKTSVYFPTIKDVLGKCTELVSQPRCLEWKDPCENMDRKDLPSPEKVKENIKKIKEIVSKNASKYKIMYS